MGKIKQFLESNTGKDVMVVLIVVFVGIASFELGRMTQKHSEGGLKIDYKAEEANVLSTGIVNESIIDQNTASQPKGNFVASKNGTKYYGITCSAGKSIKEENKIYFATADDAINAGYTPSTACR